MLPKRRGKIKLPGLGFDLGDASQPPASTGAVGSLSDPGLERSVRIEVEPEVDFGDHAKHFTAVPSAVRTADPLGGGHLVEVLVEVAELLALVLDMDPHEIPDREHGE